MQKKLRVRKIPLSELLDILIELEENGIEFIDIMAIQDEISDSVVIMEEDCDDDDTPPLTDNDLDILM
jgi:hypothetical protein